MTVVALVRHGETDWNRIGRIQGSSDIPLNDTGRGQARAAGVELAALGDWSLLLSSPLSRAKETAEIIGERLGMPWAGAIPALAERRYGLAEGLTGAELDERWPEGTPIPGQETRAEVVERALGALRGFAAEHPGAGIIAVTHGGVISSLLRHLTDWQLPRPGEFVRNGSVHLFRLVDDAVVIEASGGESDFDFTPFALR